jgi:uncharacterized membrane protein YeiB
LDALRGFAMQMKRASSMDINFASRFRRRLLIMFVLGLLHAILFYVGDILTVYAITGLFLVLFRNKSDRYILRAAVILTLLPIVQYAIMLGINVANPPAPSPPETGPRFLDQVINTYRTGTYLEIIKNNLGGLIIGRYPDLFFTGRFFRVLAMFLIGFYVSKNMIHANVQAYRPLIHIYELRLGNGSIGRTRETFAHRICDLHWPIDLQPCMAALFPFRPGRMALEIVDLQKMATVSEGRIVGRWKFHSGKA